MVSEFNIRKSSMQVRYRYYNGYYAMSLFDLEVLYSTHISQVVYPGC